MPDNYNANTKYSLIFDFHGRGGDSDNQHDNSQYYNYAASSKYVVVYPQGVQGSFGTHQEGFQAKGRRV